MIAKTSRKVAIDMTNRERVPNSQDYPAVSNYEQFRIDNEHAAIELSNVEQRQIFGRSYEELQKYDGYINLQNGNSKWLPNPGVPTEGEYVGDTLAGFEELYGDYWD